MRSSYQEFVVNNRIRSMIFVLLYVELFVFAFWLLPHFVGLFVGATIFSSLAVIGFSNRLRRSMEQQVFDRIQLKDHGVEYSSGLFGESWDRPYNEFRVDCQIRNILFITFYNVRLKHRVLTNILIGSTTSQEAAGEKVSELVDNSRLRFTKN